MTARDAATYLRCSVSTVRRLVHAGELPHYRLGKMVRFRRSEIDAWLVLHHEGNLPPDPVVFNPNQLSLFESDVLLSR
jgi:excisionase family DNA binding protein